MARNRRKIDRAQATADLKVRSAKLMRVLLALAGLGAAGTALVFAGTFGHRWLTTSPTFAIRTIAVSGNSRAPGDELIRLSGLAPGRNLFTADIETAESAVAQQPWIKTVSVRRRFPNSVSITVTEREPALVVDLGKLYFADRDGSLFKRALGGDDLDLPVVTGLSRQQFQEKRVEIEAQLRGLIGFVESYHAKGLDNRYRLEELNLDADDGLTAQLAPLKNPAEGLQAIKLGEAPYEEKLDKLATLWDEFARRGVRAQVVRLDNRTRPNWVAVKLALTEPAAAPAPKARP